jgi:hypothetical protein
MFSHFQHRTLMCVVLGWNKGASGIRFYGSGAVAMQSIRISKAVVSYIHRQEVLERQGKAND